MPDKLGAKPCADIPRTLTNETRLAVVQPLLEQALQVNQLNESLPVSQSLLSHHLRILREAVIIVGSRRAKAVNYELSPTLRTAQRGKSLNLGYCQLAFPS